jgi:asparagine synthase (glutamine-hydrolysing)
MCGIFGFVGRPNQAESVDLDAAVRLLRHRGPNGHGTFRQLADTGGVACAFAHTRLAIVDLTSRADQPMTSPDGRFTLVFNGEVFNFPSIREELAREGVIVRSSGDTEVVLKAFVHWGEACVRRFRGMFAFAVWDRHTGRLFAARDRLGIKPFYYSVSRAGLAFASELRPLLELGFSARRLSLPAVVGYLRSGSVQEPATIVDDVQMLEAGWTMSYAGVGSPSAARFWDFPPPSTAMTTFEEAVEELKPVLRDAVTLRLVSDVPLGVFLSGGIDSTVVTAIAAASLQGALQTFTVTFDEREYSEARWAAEVAEHYGCDHHQVHLPAAKAAAEIEQVIDSLDQPSADGVNTWFVSKAARQAGLTVALSGLGGDELFAGYGAFTLFKRALGLRRAAGFIPRSLYEPLDKAISASGSHLRLRRVLKLALHDRDSREAYASIRCVFLDDQILGVLSPELRAEAARFMAATPAAAVRGVDDSDPVNLLSRLELENYMKSTLLRDADVMSMAHGLEVRVPLVDHLLVEKTLSIAGRFKLQAGKQKPLLTATVPSLPAAVITRPKMGFVFPLDEWLRSAMSKWFVESFREATRHGDTILDARAIEAVLTGFHAGTSAFSVSRVWSLFVLASVCRRLGITASALPIGTRSREAAAEQLIGAS